MRYTLYKLNNFVRFSIAVLIIGTHIACHAATFVHTVPIHCSHISESNKFFNSKFIAFMQKWQVPGSSIAVMKNHEMVLSCAYGWANVNERKPMQPDSVLRIGSVSKTITALAIMQLVQAHQLDLDDKVFAVLDNLKPFSHSKVSPQIYQITLRNLLQMSAGWYTDRPQDYDPLIGPWSNDMLEKLHYQIPPTCVDAARVMMSMPLQFTPGSEYSYSNLNYCLLGLVINKVIHQSGAQAYLSYVQNHLLKPIGINDMQLGSTLYKNRAAKEVKYYFFGNKDLYTDIERVLDGLPYSHAKFLENNYADGGWIASAPSLVNILQAFYDQKIIPADLVETMLEKPSYAVNDSDHPGMGWDKIAFTNGQRYYTKTGSFTGTKAYVKQNAAGVSYAVLFNSKPEKGDEFIKQLDEQLASIILD